MHRHGRWRHLEETAVAPSPSLPTSLELLGKGTPPSPLTQSTRACLDQAGLGQRPKLKVRNSLMALLRPSLLHGSLGFATSVLLDSPPATACLNPSPLTQSTRACLDQAGLGQRPKLKVRNWLMALLRPYLPHGSIEYATSVLLVRRQASRGHAGPGHHEAVAISTPKGALGHLFVVSRPCPPPPDPGGGGVAILCTGMEDGATLRKWPLRPPSPSPRP